MNNRFRHLFSLKTLIHLLILRPFVKLMFGINIYGREHLDTTDNFIIIANHNSHLDILLLFYILPSRLISKTHPLAAEEYFSRYRLLYKIVDYLFSPIWVARDDQENRGKALTDMKAILDKGHNVILFPEGSRGDPGKITPFKYGIGKLAEGYRNTPILPVFLFGPERALPKKYSIPVPIWMHIMINPPRVFSGSYLEATQALENTIRELDGTETVLYHCNKSKPKKKAFSVGFIGIDGSGK
ncbi:lysophospholipid acyltransferase family protein, partial [candidate division KSB1 bacterium]